MDEYDCSRQLAHVFLFEHDHRVVADVGEKNYVRWMDDQNIGARDHTHARRIVNDLTRSLSSQRLTLNSGKTLFLEPKDVVEHFQLDANKLISAWQKAYEPKLPAAVRKARSRLRKLWTKISSGPSAGKGLWDKILKRMYACAAKVDSPLIDDRMYHDLIDYPDLYQRIFESLARRNEGSKLVQLFETYCENGESLFEATEAAFFEACLLLDASDSLERRLRKVARRFVRGALKGQSGGFYGKASAMLCMYWFGLGGTGLIKLFSPEEASVLPAPVARAWLGCVVAKDAKLLPTIQRKLVANPSPDVAKLSGFLGDVLDGAIERVGNYKNQKSRWPKPGKFYDVRAWLQLELISWASSKKLRATAKSDMRPFAKLARTRQEKRRLVGIGLRLT